MRTARPLAFLVLALACGAPAMAQQDVAVDDLLRAAIGLRRQGKFTAATAAFEQALVRMPKGPQKKDVALETARMFEVTGRPDKALLLYRKNHDVEREVQTLLSMGKDRYGEALAVCRLVGHRKGEAAILARLGRGEQALKMLEIVPGSEPERAELLLELHRYRDAAALYGRLQDFFAQARALERAGDKVAAKRAYEDAVEQIKFRVRTESRKKAEKAKEYFEHARGGVSRERARLKLAEAYGELAEDFRHLAAAYVGAGLSGATAAQLAQSALSFIQRQRETLEDAGAGGDAFGRRLAESLGLPLRLTEIQAEIASYRSLGS